MKIYIPTLIMMIFLTNCQQDIDYPVIDQASKSGQVSGEAFRMTASFPQQIFLPDGFQPEGIESGKGTEFYVGSLEMGAIYKGDFRTGEGFLLVQPQAGRIAVGLCYDERTDYLYVAGGPNGNAYVYQGKTGVEVAEIPLTSSSTTFVNDCIVTRDAVYFTDSFQEVYYRVPLGRGGRLPDLVTSETIDLSSNFDFIAGAFNSNGIVTSPDGNQLIIGNSVTGKLYLVEPLTGEVQLIDLGGDLVFYADGLILEGRMLYVVQNFLNKISVVQLQPGYMAGEVVGIITSPEFKLPATATIFGSKLYAVNARFDVEPTPTTTYDVIMVDKHIK